MSNNDLVLIDQLLDRRRAELPTWHPDRVFELFACETTLSECNLSDAEMLDGISGGTDDGAIDGVYVFLDDMLLSEDVEQIDSLATSGGRSTPKLLLWVVQAKVSPGFTERAIDLVSSSLGRLLDLGAPTESLRELYSDSVIARVGVFKTALLRLVGRHPKVEVRFSYVTRGTTADVNKKVLRKANDLESQLSKVTSGAVGKVELLGAAELWERVNTRRSYTLQLPYRENATSADGSSHIALVSLHDYAGFLSNEQGQLQRHIFDWNVRDYQTGASVNKEIAASLNDPESPEFWWLNNGVTILCSKASITNRTFVLDDVQIVNGLQTSETIHRELAGTPESVDRLRLKSIMVRILVTTDPSVRDQVIRATNSQTSVAPASLRATDEIQRDIERFFHENLWYYDRRKGFYKNSGMAPHRIVSIAGLAQSVMAMGLSRPDDSRARPSSLLSKDEVYQQIFDPKTPLEVYLWCVRAQQVVDSFLASGEAKVDSTWRINFRFHLSMLAAATLIGGTMHHPSMLTKLTKRNASIKDAKLGDCISFIMDTYYLAAKGSQNTMEKISKRQDFVQQLLERRFS